MTQLSQRQLAAPFVPPRENSDEEVASHLAPVQGYAISYFVSVVLHGSLLMILAFFVFGNTTETLKDDLLETRIDPIQEPEVPALAEVAVENLLTTKDEQDSSKMLKNTHELANASSEPPPINAAYFSDRGLLPTANPNAGNGFGGDALAGLGESAGVGANAGNGDREKGDGEVGFFGAKEKGKSFVFIVDCSGSMTTTTNAYQPRMQAPPTRFLRARQELYQSLAQLSENQSFYVIFYNHETYPMFFPRNAQSLLQANPEFLGMARNWILKVDPGGGTDPRHAFEVALALRPEVIFFLTDGAIPAATRPVAKGNNKSRTRIHTIAFGNQQNQDTLKGIAADNQGRYRFVQ